jgi:hypothetical protein
MLFEFATRTFGEEYRPTDEFAELGGDPGMLEFFVPWALYHYRVRGLSVADHYLYSAPRQGPVAELVALMRSACALLTIWEVVESRPGEGLRLRDMVAGFEREVVERTASRVLRRWQVLLARVSRDREPQILGLHPRTLPPREGSAAAEEVSRELAGRPGKVARSRLQEAETADLLVRA